MVKLSEIKEKLSAVETAIRKGNFELAEELGNAFEPPLCVPSSELITGEILYAGEQGTVSKGKWRNRDVAIKKMKISSSADMDRLKIQVRQLLLLGKHDRLCQLIAARLLPPNYLLIHPLYQRSLADPPEDQKGTLSWRQVAAYGLQLAEAIAHVHSDGIIHRDVKPGNLLIDEAGSLHLSDFGISVFDDELQAEMQGGKKGSRQPSGGFYKRHMVGTLEYLAPEVLLNQPYGLPIDIFAWAVTVNEIATSVVPYSDCTKENPAAHTVLNFGYGRQELAAGIVSEGLRPLMRSDTPEEFASLLEACWHVNPRQRPSVNNLVSQLQALLPKMPATIPQASEPAVSAQLREQQRQKASLQQNTDNADRIVQDYYRDSSGNFHRDGSSGTVARTGNLDKDPSWARKTEGATTQKVVAGIFETAGLRGEDRMEDRCVIASPIQPGNEQTHCFAVFDGHRGKHAAQYAAEHLLEYLSHYWGSETAEEAFQGTFLDLDEAFREQEGGQVSGCTAIVALVSHDRLWVANAGDCRAVLCQSGKALQLNKEHNAENAEERARTESHGGSFELLNGTWRLGKAGIQVTRSLGDGDLKQSGLTACPEVTSLQLDEGDEFMVIASDGLWDKLSSQDAVDLVRDTVKDATMCAQRLATEALTRGSGDNITVIVVFLQPVRTLEAIFQDGKHKHRPASTFYGGR